MSRIPLVDQIMSTNSIDLNFFIISWSRLVLSHVLLLSLSFLLHSFYLQHPNLKSPSNFLFLTYLIPLTLLESTYMVRGSKGCVVHYYKVVDE